MRSRSGACSIASNRSLFRPSLPRPSLVPPPSARAHLTPPFPSRPSAPQIVPMLRGGSTRTEPTAATRTRLNSGARAVLTAPDGTPAGAPLLTTQMAGTTLVLPVAPVEEAQALIAVAQVRAGSLFPPALHPPPLLRGLTPISLPSTPASLQAAAQPPASTTIASTGWTTTLPTRACRLKIPTGVTAVAAPATKEAAVSPDSLTSGLLHAFCFLPPHPSHPSDDDECPATCFGYDCEYWIDKNEYYTCSSLEIDVGCDCSGCACAGGGGGES